MRIFALCVGLIGLFILYGYFIETPALLVSLNSTQIHTDVLFTGPVLSERAISSDFKILSFEFGSAACSCPNALFRRNVSIIGFVDSYNEIKQVRVLSLRVL